MPSTSPAQHRLMEAVAHGWRPSDEKGPSEAVARDFVDADKKTGKYQGKKRKKHLKKSENNSESRASERFSDLLKALSPGQPAAPHPSKPRAPRPAAPFDPVEGAKHSSSPYIFRPIRLKDLWKLHQLDKYDPQKIKKPSFPSYIPAGVKSIPTPGFNKLKLFVKAL